MKWLIMLRDMTCRILPFAQLGLQPRLVLVRIGARALATFIADIQPSTLLQLLIALLSRAASQVNLER